MVSFALTEDAKHKTEALVANINSAYFGVETYATDEEKAVAYLYFIIKDHPFTDGNKRTATLTFEIICDLNGLHPDYGKAPLDSLAVYIEKTKEQDHKNVIKVLSNLIFK